MKPAAANRPTPEPAGLDADLQLGLGERDLLRDQAGDVTAGVGDQTTDGRVGVEDRFGGHASVLLLVRGERGSAHDPTIPLGWSIGVPGSLVGPSATRGAGGSAAATRRAYPMTRPLRRRSAGTRTRSGGSAPSTPRATARWRGWSRGRSVTSSPVEAAGSVVLLAAARGRAGLGELAVVRRLRRLLAQRRHRRPRRAPPRGHPPALGERRPHGASSSSSSGWRSSTSWSTATCATRRTAALPIVAAFGGMVVPAAIYRLVVGGGDGERRAGASRWPPTSRSRSACSACSAAGSRRPPGCSC